MNKLLLLLLLFFFSSPFLSSIQISNPCKQNKETQKPMMKLHSSFLGFYYLFRHASKGGARSSGLELSAWLCFWAQKSPGRSKLVHNIVKDSILRPSSHNRRCETGMLVPCLRPDD